ncbi:RNA-binding domain-containing protein [Acaromyces ingoldii]|uniref:U1 small nuclear ribonucleoprotein 70 kDa n=1 Tax=Acaromyces ingoldii TaxID=215250 RepID=A0A316YM92_9BASI|nr:RNA-binding domain-containing protein [Acaromyces ingoldii]PWN89193.1 RNA-binding domain-containing protein [Acaromyces ingoldii]
MTHQLPPQLLRLFAARPPLSYVPALSTDKDLTARPAKTHRPLEGVAAFLERVRQEAADKGEATNDVPDENAEGELTYAEQTKRDLRREQKTKEKEEKKKKGLESYDPKSDPEAQGDPFTTLFLSRLDYSTTEKDLAREFDMYGPISRIRIVRDREGKSRGYAFVVYQHERDMRAAYKDAEGIKIHGRRLMVDVERGRTVKDWKPMRLGGGLGGLTRKKKEPVQEAMPAFGMGMGMRGGFGGRGGFRGGRGGGGGFGRGRGGGGFGGPPRDGFGGGPPRGGYGAPPGPGGGAGGGGGYGPPRGGAGPGGYGGGARGGFGGPPSAGPPAGYSGGGGYGPPGGGYGSGDGYGRADGPPSKRGRY